MWGDVENAAASWLRSRHPGVRVVNELPSDLENKVPLLCVRIVPGGGDDRINDTAIVDVEAFGANRTAMWTLAEDARTSMLAINGHAAAGVRIDTAETDSRPGEVPYGNPAVRRAVASYRLTCRAQATA